MRRIIAGFIILCCLGMPSSLAAASDATPAADAPRDYLFVQSFGASTITPSADDPASLTLTLTDGTGQTLYFSDRPNRVAGSVRTDRFIEVFRQETEDDPANAALVAQTAGGDEVIHVVELLEMEVDPASGTVRYTVRLLENPTEIDLRLPGDPVQSITSETRYGPSNLFIDAGGLMQLVAYGA